MKNKDLLPILSELFDLPKDQLAHQAKISPSEEDKELSSQHIEQVSHALENEFLHKPIPLERIMSSLEPGQSPATRALLTSKDVLSGINRMMLLKSLEFPVDTRLEKAKSGFNLHIKLNNTKKECTFFYLLEFLILTNLLRHATKVQFIPKSVALPLLPEQILHQIENNFDIQLKASDHLEIHFSHEEIALPVRSLHEFDQPHLNDISAKKLKNEVKALIQQILPSGDHHIKIIASKLGTSPRTLQRRLAGQGLNYKELVNETRFELAKFYLSDPQLSIKETAYLVGYAEPSPFYRAFKNLSGYTPAEFAARQT